MYITHIAGRALEILLVAVCLVAEAKADSVTFLIGDDPQPNEQNVLLNTGGPSGLSVFGLTNQTHVQVRFNAATETIFAPSSGQARIEASDGLLNNLTISVPNGTFRAVVFNPFFGSGNANLFVITANNQAFNFSYPLSNGGNFLTIIAGTENSIFSVTIDSPGGFTDLRQVRIAGVQSVPEPEAMLLLGSGLLGLASAIRLRK